MTVPPSAGMVAWFRADDVAGGDGDPVSAWDDRTANNYDLAEATNQPTKQTVELNGQTIVRFDGTNDVLSRASTPVIDIPYTYIVIGKITNVTDGGVNKTLFGDASGASQMYHRFTGAFTGETSIYADTEKSGTIVPNGSTWYVYEACFNRVYSWLRLGNGRQELVPNFNNDPGNGNNNQSVGFAAGYASSPLPGDIADIIVYNRALRDEDHRDILNYAFERYALGAAIGAEDTSYGNEGGAGYRVGEPFITTTATLGAGRIYNLLDAAFSDNADDGFWWDTGQSSREIVFDFGVGASKIIDAFTWYQSTAATHGTWNFRGSNDGSSYTTIITGLTLGGATSTEYTGTNTTGYRYYKLEQTAGTVSGTPWIREIEFRIAKDSSDAATSLHNPGGRGARNALISVTTDDVTGTSGDVANLVDGGMGGSAADSFDFASAWTGSYIRFDFGVGVAKIIDAFVLSSNDAAVDFDTWKIQGSNNAVAWTDLGSTFTLAGYYDTIVTFANTTAYRYYQLVPVSSPPFGGTWVNEIDFKLKDGTPPSPPASDQIVLITAISG